jgi:hypothetical protein
VERLPDGVESLDCTSTRLLAALEITNVWVPVSIADAGIVTVFQPATGLTDAT